MLTFDQINCFVGIACKFLFSTKVLWNRRPLHRPAANRMCLHKEVNSTTWWLGFESCSNKDSTPLPNSVGTKRDASGWGWGFLVSMKAIGLQASAAFNKAMGSINDGKWICWASGKHCGHVYSARSTKLAQLLSSCHFLFTPCGGLHITKVLWNQRPLRRPAANRMRLHKEVNGATWQLSLESCSNKDSTPLPNSVGTKRDASSTFVPK